MLSTYAEFENMLTLPYIRAQEILHYVRTHIGATLNAKTSPQSVVKFT